MADPNDNNENNNGGNGEDPPAGNAALHLLANLAVGGDGPPQQHDHPQLPLGNNQAAVDDVGNGDNNDDADDNVLIDQDDGDGGLLNDGQGDQDQQGQPHPPGAWHPPMMVPPPPPPGAAVAPVLPPPPPPPAAPGPGAGAAGAGPPAAVVPPAVGAVPPGAGAAPPAAAPAVAAAPGAVPAMTMAQFQQFLHLMRAGNQQQLEHVVRGFDNIIRAQERMQKKKEEEDQKKKQGIERKLSVFSTANAEDWLNWREHYNAVSDLKGWDEEYRRKMIRSSMYGDALACVSGIHIDEIPAHPGAPAQPLNGLPAVAPRAARPALTSEQILDAYEAKFVPEGNSYYARQAFLESRQRHSESLVEWHTRLIRLYRRAEPQANTDTTKELIERFGTGIHDHRIIEELVNKRPDTMSKALNIATSKQGALSAYSEVKRIGRRTTAGLYSLDTERKSENVQCWLCKERGHIRSECPSNKERDKRSPAYSAGRKGPRKGGRFSKSNRGGGNKKGGKTSRFLGAMGEAKEKKEEEKSLNEDVSSSDEQEN